MFVPQTYDKSLWRYIAFCTHPSNEFVTKVARNPASQSLRMPSDTRIEQIGTLCLSITLRIGLKTQILSLGLEYRHAQLYSYTAQFFHLLLFRRYGATSIIRKSMTSIVRKIRHIHWVLGKLSVYLAVSCLNQFRQLTAKYTDTGYR